MGRSVDDGRRLVATAEPRRVLASLPTTTQQVNKAYRRWATFSCSSARFMEQVYYFYRMQSTMTQLIYFKSYKVTKIQSFFVNYLQTVIYVSVQHLVFALW